MLERLSQKLYLRIWLAVVSMLVLLAVLTGFVWRLHLQHERSELQANPPSLPSREIVVRDAQGQVLAHAQSKPGRRPGEVLEFEVPMPDGKTLQVQLPSRQRGGDGTSTERVSPMFRAGLNGLSAPPGVLDWRWLPSWMQPPYSFLWLLLGVSVAIAFGAYPVAKRLTQRLEALRDGVKKFGEGDLAARVTVRGKDEVGYLAEQFNASAQRVQSLVEAQKSLLANASHELRSPLARIRMGIEMLVNSEEQRVHVQRAESEIKRSIVELDQLIEEILLASKLDAVRSGKATDIGDIEAVDFLGIAAEECARVGAELILGEGETEFQVRGHARLLIRLVRNLLENARRYSHGAIDLHLTRIDIRNAGKSTTDARSCCSMIQMRVCDHGPGVPVVLRDNIFEPFYRLPGASERGGGVGLGLALVKSIALQHSGSVVCEARPDGLQGACFTVLLPHV